jgi:glycine betaine/proline transport system permease protein
MENKQLNNLSRSELITDFVKTNSNYYIKEFQKIGSKPSFSFSFNLYSAILGPVWFGMRNVWNWALAFLIIETFSVVQIIRGLFGNITADAVQKIEQVQSTIAFRNKQLEAAITNNPDKVDVYKRNIKSLEDAMQGYINEVDRIEASAIWITLFGIALLILIKIIQGVLANSILEKRYSEWLSDKTISPGMQLKNYISSTIFTGVIMFFSVVHYSFPGFISIMDNFPTHPDIRLTSIKWVETIFDFAVIKGDALFTAITFGIRSVLDFLELLFVKTPWIVIITTIVTLTGLAAGPRAAIYSTGFLCYMGFLGFWVKAMTTLALLGTAAVLSIAIGIPLGIFCARRQRFYSMIRPIMDFMQTMPAFVFMIPVIAFFGTGKVAAVIITMIFGGTPVVRLTVLGLRGVPETIREAAIAYGASKWYLLRKVDLPLATPSILAGLTKL